MNESEINSPAPVELKDQVAALQHQVFALLLALVVVSGTLTVYLYREASIVGADIAVIKPQATQTIRAFNQTHPGLDNFVKQLIVYGQTHPDFRPILQKYGLNPPPPAAPKK
jgi:cytochrome b561